MIISKKLINALHKIAIRASLNDMAIEIASVRAGDPIAAEAEVMKTAKMLIVQVEFLCPSCDGNISHESGSHYFPLHDVPSDGTCDDCGEKLKLPTAKVQKLKRIS